MNTSHKTVNVGRSSTLKERRKDFLNWLKKINNQYLFSENNSEQIKAAKSRII